MKLLKLCLFALLPLMISGCNGVDIKNGEIPAEYIKYVKPFLGKYKGKFDGRRGTMRLSLRGQKLILKINTGNGNGILPSKCRETIGELKHVSARKRDGKVELLGASFEFSPGGCSEIEGRRVNLDLVDQTRAGGVRVSVVEDSYESYTCSPSHDDFNPIDCRFETRYNSMNGFFR